MTDRPYHRADLAESLLREAETELEEKGVEGFSLRGVAKRAEVSHAAPAHHFGDAAGLLTALATRGFEKLLQTQQAREAAFEDSGDRFVASGLGYVDFAVAHPALFRLMFSSRRVQKDENAYETRAQAAFDHLRAFASEQGGGDPFVDEEARATLIAAWAIVHGLADLMINKRPTMLLEMDPETRDRVLTKVISRAALGPDGA
ncbi:MAG: TetR/AcrR family transcriptional regulator [Pseudomonadota bacterium]